MSTTYLGIDPGIHGAFAVLAPERIEVFDMPTHDIRGKTRIDLHALVYKLGEVALLHEPRIAVIEDVHSMPAQGVASSFAFGFAAAAVQVATIARGIPVRLVAPGAWKRILGLGRDKDESRRLASRLFPAFAHLWPLKKHDGRAEAVLLAHYGTMK